MATVTSGYTLIHSGSLTYPNFSGVQPVGIKFDWAIYFDRFTSQFQSIGSVGGGDNYGSGTPIPSTSFVIESSLSYPLGPYVISYTWTITSPNSGILNFFVYKGNPQTNNL
jgi:hypothetical protein